MSALKPSRSSQAAMALAGLIGMIGVFPGSAPPLRAGAEATYYLEFRALEDGTSERFSLFRDGTAVYDFKRPATPDLFLKQMLTPEEIKVYLDALRASKILNVRDSAPPGMTGQLVRTWTLTVALPGASMRTFEGSDLQVPSLAMGTTLRIVRDLSDALLKKWRDTDPFQKRAPARGDRLAGFDGHVYEVHRYVTEREQYELAGVDQPLVYYIKKGELKLFFKGYAQ